MDIDIFPFLVLNHLDLVLCAIDEVQAIWRHIWEECNRRLYSLCMTVSRYSDRLKVVRRFQTCVILVSIWVPLYSVRGRMSMHVAKIFMLDLTTKDHFGAEWGPVITPCSKLGDSSRYGRLIKVPLNARSIWS